MNGSTNDGMSTYSDRNPSPQIVISIPLANSKYVQVWPSCVKGTTKRFSSFSPESVRRPSSMVSGNPAIVREKVAFKNVRRTDCAHPVPESMLGRPWLWCRYAVSSTTIVPSFSTIELIFESCNSIAALIGISFLKRRPSPTTERGIANFPSGSGRSPASVHRFVNVSICLARHPNYRVPRVQMGCRDKIAFQ